MKKIFSLLLVLAMLLSFSACNSISENESSDISSDISEIKQPFYDDILLSFGAEKTDKNRFRTLKSSGFLYDIQFEDASTLDIKYYFAWANKKFSEKYSDWNTRFKSLHGDNLGYSFPAEEFETIVCKYFGTSTDYLRSDTSFYCSEHNAYCSPGSATVGESKEFTVISTEQNNEIVTIKISFQNRNMALTTAVSDDGNFKYLSYLPENCDSENATSLFLGLGENIEPSELSLGERLGQWTVSKIDTPSDLHRISVKFSGDVMLVGHISANGLLENTYDFIPLDTEESNLPCIFNTDFKKYSGVFTLNISDEYRDILAKKLSENEDIYCRITATGLELNRGYTMTTDTLDVTTIFIMTGIKLSPEYEDMILNFGALKVDEGTLHANKGVSLYYMEDGFEDGKNLSDLSYFSWALFYLNKSYDYETMKSLFIHPDGLEGWAYPADYYEPVIYKFFGVSPDVLRNSELYDSENKIYYLGAGFGIGDTPYIVVNSVEENSDTVVFHLTLNYLLNDNPDMALTVKLLPNGEYNYISYLPE